MNNRQDRHFYEDNMYYLTSQDRRLYLEARGRKEEIEAQIGAIDGMLRQLPQGKFTCRRNGKGYKYFHKKTGPDPAQKALKPESCDPPGNQGPQARQTPVRRDNYEYLPKSEAKLAGQLAMRRYLESVEQDLSNEEKAIDAFVTCIDRNGHNAEKCHAATGMAELIDPEIQKSRAELDAWQNDDYEHSTSFPKDLTVQTIGGFCVRSKSEALIANLLIERGIPFRYEWVQVIDGKTCAPDFTILHPVKREIVIWEHFGLMNSADYQAEYRAKLSHYILAGYLPYYNLITTYERSEKPFSVDTANRIVRMMFNC